MHRNLRFILILLVSVTLVGSLSAQVEPDKLPSVTEKAFEHPGLTIETLHQEVAALPVQSAVEARARLSRMDVAESSARIDQRSGRFVTLMPTTPLIPGRGVGNDLSWQGLSMGAPQDTAAVEQAAFNAFRGYLEANQADLGISVAELGEYRIAAHDMGDLVQIWIPREFDGIPVRNSYLSAVIGQGNLTLMSAHQWGDRGLSTARGKLDANDAKRIAERYMAPIKITGEWGDGDAELLYVPMAKGLNPTGVALGNGYDYRLVYSVKVTVEGDMGQWEVLVDAATGDVLANKDMNHYAEAKGGVYPVTNDGINPDGVEQAGWPMPWLTVNGTSTDTGGNVALSGSLTASLTGQYVRMNDNCGSSSLTQTGNLDFGTSGGTDCTTPGFGGAGNTHASRSGFYELNRTKEMARGQLPSNGWLTNQLTSNMNINSTCNAFWNGSTVNFYRSGGGCSNTGEIAGVFVHEWGHGMDANDVNGGIASPSGEGIADVYTALRLNDSCIGRNFRSTVCTGNGDPCDTCTGVRDIDYLARQSNNPHTYTWSNSNCGGSVHCVGGVYSEAVWSLWKRKLQQAPYNLDNNTAHEIVTRLTFLGAGATGTWFSGGAPNGGCGGSSGYMNYLAADDDNGNLNDGTPHMGAIYAAFNDQQIACGSPTVQDSGCASVPTTAPNVTATPGNNQVALSWGAVSGATQYEVFRAEGIFACDFGKVKVADSASTSFTDTGLQNGRDYSYVVIPKSSSNACFGPASACDTVQPADGPECVIDADCNDGLFCNGTETCNGSGACVAGSDPCPGQGCDEVNDVCTAGGPCTHAADFSSGTGGWSNGSSSCTTGSFVVGSPDATAWQVGGGNPGNAYYTQPNPGGIGTDDVDGGTCEALSPVVDCAGNSAADISLDYFHGQRDAGDDAADGFTIEVLNDGVVVDTLVNIGDVTNNPAWTTVSTTVASPGDIQIRVRATDAAGPGDIVEGGIDNVLISPAGPECVIDADCNDGLFCNGTETCNGSGACVAGSNPCAAGETCNEATDTCTPGSTCAVDDDFESGTVGWANDAASTCSTGDYVEGNPTSVVNGGVTTQIGGSHSGVTSIFTATNTSAGVNDVDGGNCILSSPSWAVGSASTLSVWYWHGQRDAGDDAAGDFFRLEYSTNGGSTWSTLASAGDVTSNAVWTEATASIPAGSNVELRVQCSDGSAGGDLVECGIDDVSICN